MHCELCQYTPTSAPPEDWVFSYWIRHSLQDADHNSMEVWDEMNCSFCPNCARKELTFNEETGDYERKTVFVYCTTEPYFPTHELGGEG